MEGSVWHPRWPKAAGGPLFPSTAGAKAAGFLGGCAGGLANGLERDGGVAGTPSSYSSGSGPARRRDRTTAGRGCAHPGNPRILGGAQAADTDHTKRTTASCLAASCRASIGCPTG